MTSNQLGSSSPWWMECVQVILHNEPLGPYSLGWELTPSQPINDPIASNLHTQCHLLGRK